MTVPDYQSLMLPVLHAIADGQSHRLADVRTTLAEQLGLTEEDRALKIPSGSPVFDSRVHWAVTYMSGLIRRPRRAVVELTTRGREVLAENPAAVDNVLLARYPEFLDFKMRARDRQPSHPGGDVTHQGWWWRLRLFVTLRNYREKGEPWRPCRADPTRRRSALWPMVGGGARMWWVGGGDRAYDRK